MEGPVDYSNNDTTSERSTEGVSDGERPGTHGGLEVPLPQRLGAYPVEAARDLSDPGAAELQDSLLYNDYNDERICVMDPELIMTPRLSSAGSHQQGVALTNAAHDEAIAVHETDVTKTPAESVASGTAPGTPQFRGPRSDDDDNEEEEEEGAGLGRGYPGPHSQAPETLPGRGGKGEDLAGGGGMGTHGAPNAPRSLRGDSATPSAYEEPAAANAELTPNDLAYSPAKYAKVNAKASRAMQDLFKHILDYQPMTAELSAKLLPFIPDYIPAVGELDPFVKIPRADGCPEGLGLYLLDEPSIPQSNPAVVLLELRATNAHVGELPQVVDSFEDAPNRPEVLNRWIADVKKVHYKKPLPTVNYSKPMPDINTLLQAWPAGFEEFLNANGQLPSPGIDLDLEQYARLLCVLLDIPVYNSLIDSLHVMFTLYEEFRNNQHFQHV